MSIKIKSSDILDWNILLQILDDIWSRRKKKIRQKKKKKVIKGKTDHFLWHEIFYCKLLTDHFDKKNIRESFSITSVIFFFSVWQCTIVAVEEGE